MSDDRPDKLTYSPSSHSWRKDGETVMTGTEYSDLLTNVTRHLYTRQIKEHGEQSITQDVWLRISRKAVERIEALFK